MTAKTILALLCAVSLCAAGGISSGADRSTPGALEDPLVGFRPLSKTIEPGAVCTLQVMVEGAADSIGCMEIFVAFDAAHADLVSVLEGSAFKTAGWPTFFRWESIAADTASAVDCLLGYRSYFLAPGELAKLVFRGTEPGVCRVRLASVRLWDIGRVEVSPVAGADAEIIIGWSTPAGPAPPPGSTFRSFPNPFNPATTLVLEAGPGAAGRDATVAIYTAEGRLVRTLYEGRLGPGGLALPWDGRDGRGETVEAGVYVAVAETSGETIACKLVVVR